MTAERRHLAAAAAEGIGAANHIDAGPADLRLRALLDRLSATILPRRVEIAGANGPPLLLHVENARLWRMGTAEVSDDTLCEVADALRALAESPVNLTLRSSRQEAERPAHLPGISIAALGKAVSCDLDAAPQDTPLGRLGAIASLHPAPPQGWLGDGALLIVADDLMAGPLTLVTDALAGHAPQGSLERVVSSWLGHGSSGCRSSRDSKE